MVLVVPDDGHPDAVKQGARHAAKRAGLMAGWAARLEGRYGEIFTPADVIGADLVEVAHGLVDLEPG